jgi:hypothetical protein
VEEVTGIDLHDLSYLLGGAPRQRAAFAAITEAGVMRDLAAFTPALAGTVPLGIDTEASDLDIICRAEDLAGFAGLVHQLYGNWEGFALSRYPVRGVESVVASFRHGGWGFELFAQDVPVAEQYACLHLLAEARLLAAGGEAAREAIRALKRQGLKTEPAFARHFGLAGDPYEALARLGRSGG